MAKYKTLISIAGAGTMGSGIALAALYQALPVVLFDISPSMLDQARAYIEKFLAKRGLQGYQNMLQVTNSLEDLGAGGFVIEAIPEDLPMKKELIGRLDSLCPPPVILATNTSTLSVSAIATAAQSPYRVVGLHFFNPAPVMPLVEVIRGYETSRETVDAAISLAERMKKTPVLAADAPGFIVNRVARPFYGEAVRLLAEGVSDPERIDRIITGGGGFRMGPFQLMDLIGLDVNLAAMQSMYDQTFGEPRYRPHPLQANLVAQGKLGVKTGRGFYTYPSENKPRASLQPPPPKPRDGLVFTSPGTWGPGVAGLFKAGGYDILYQDIPADREAGSGTSYPQAGLVLAGREEGLLEWAYELDRRLSPTTPIICQAADMTVHEIAGELRHPERLVGFDGLFAANGDIVTLVPGPGQADKIRDRVSELFAGLGRLPVWITDSPALILPRVVGMLVNEGSFAALEGVAEPETIDQAMRLGVNYPVGPIAWGQAIGFQRVVAVLDHLYKEYGEDRFRASVLLRRWARLSRNLRWSGHG